VLHTTCLGRINSLCSNDRFEQYQDTFDPITSNEVVENLSDAVFLVMSNRNMPHGTGFKTVMDSRRKSQAQMLEALEAIDEQPSGEFVLKKERSGDVMAEGSQRDAMMGRLGRSQLASSQSMVRGTGSATAVQASGVDSKVGLAGGDTSVAGGTRSGSEVPASEKDRDGRTQLTAKEKRAAKHGDKDKKSGDADSGVDADDTDSDSDDDDALGGDAEERRKRKLLKKQLGGEDGDDTTGKRKQKWVDDEGTEVATPKQKRLLPAVATTIAARRRFRKIKASFR